MLTTQDILDKLGVNPLCVTPANVHVLSYYLPSLLNEWKIHQAALEKRMDDLKVDRDEAHVAERIRLMGLNAKGSGPGGAKLYADDIKFLSKNGSECLRLDREINKVKAEINQVKGYRAALRAADVKVNSYLGHAREEIALNYRQHAASHNFHPPSHIPRLEPIAYDPETGEILEGEEDEDEELDESDYDQDDLEDAEEFSL